MIFKKVKKFVDEARPDFPAHYQNTVDWLLRLYPEADEVMQAAAYAHDIERAFRDKNEKNIFVFQQINTDDPSYLKIHQEKGARIIKDFLENENFSKNEVERVNNMVLHHEEGGDFESDLIKDADSLSFFDVNALGFTDKFFLEIGFEKIKGKFEFMLNRISSAEAKKLAKPLYEKALNSLNLKVSKQG